MKKKNIQQEIENNIQIQINSSLVKLINKSRSLLDFQEKIVKKNRTSANQLNSFKIFEKNHCYLLKYSLDFFLLYF